MCSALVGPGEFWEPGDLSESDRVAWYAYFGSVDARLQLEGLEETSALPDHEEFVGGRESDQATEPTAGDLGEVNLRAYDPGNYGATAVGDPNRKIEAVYSAGLLDRAARLHDAMVVLIGNIAVARGAAVLDDPKSVDLLIRYRDVEFIVEVKTVAGRSFIGRLRLAIGQLLHYDYRRSLQGAVNRRKVIAIAAKVPDGSWCYAFLSGFLDFDVLTLDGDILRIYSTNPVALDLFGPRV
jgi:hypothetical protein